MNLKSIQNNLFSVSDHQLYNIKQKLKLKINQQLSRQHSPTRNYEELIHAVQTVKSLDNSQTNQIKAVATKQDKIPNSTTSVSQSNSDSKTPSQTVSKTKSNTKIYQIVKAEPDIINSAESKNNNRHPSKISIQNIETKPDVILGGSFSLELIRRYMRLGKHLKFLKKHAKLQILQNFV